MFKIIGKMELLSRYLTFFLFVALSSFYCSKADLTISGIQCGQIKCRVEEFCSEFERICKPCASICAQDHHNFDENGCIKNCQDYLHNIRYLQRNQSGLADSNLEKLKGDVERLSAVVSTTLILVCFMLVVLVAVLGFQLYRWKIKKNITLQNLRAKLFGKPEATPDSRVEDPTSKNIGKTSTKPDLRLEISNITPSLSDHSPVTSTTTVSTRRPAEDSALDYAYDNHAMSSSPR